MNITDQPIDRYRYFKSLEDEFLDALDGHKCESCGQYKEDVEYRENPYNAEIYDDYSEHWLCDNCSWESSMDI